MIAENKAEFFEQLQRELEKLGVEDTGELMGDLEEHFAEGERRGIPEAEICRELGSIAEIARSCLDLKSTAINSMVARDVERRRVSLTKPGYSVPADPSLAAGNTIPVDGADLPSYTPEHISSEVYPDPAQIPPQFGANVGSGGAAGENSADIGSDNANVSGESSANAGGGTENENADGGTFEKVGKVVDGALDKAGKALNDALGKAGGAVNGALNKAGSVVGAFRPSDSYREHVNNSRDGGEIPPQYTKAEGHGGSEFVDTSNLKPNVNGGRLAFEIILDVFLWSWLIPVVFSLVLALGTAAIGLTVIAIECFLGKYDFAQFKFITRVLFSVGFINITAAVFCLACLAVKAPIAFVKKIISRHIRAIYDI